MKVNQKHKLGDFFKIKHGYAFKGEYFSDFGPFIVLTPGNFHEEGGFKLKSKEKYYTGDFPKAFLLKKNDLIIAMTEQGEGLLGSSAVIPDDNLFLHNQRLGLITELDEQILNNKFLYYLFNTQSVRAQIRASANGAKVRHTSPSRIYDVEFNYLPIKTQRKIASILSAYDDLIENNTRRIKILEEMARMLYREWFVNFRFPGHEQVKMVDSPLGMIPEGWEVRDLLDLSEVTYGFAFKADQFSVEPIGKPVIRIRDVLEGRSSTYSTEKPADKYLVQNGDVLVGMDGDFHMGFWVGGEAYLVQRVARFRSKGDMSNYHLFLAMEKPIQDFNATITGTTVAHLGDKHIKTIQVAWPDTSLRAKANQVFESILKQLLTLRLKNQNLRQTRDLLLPKLISGEISLCDSDK